MYAFNPTQTLPMLYTFCKVCEARLHIPEQWQSGLCASCAADPLPSLADDPDWQSWLSLIDEDLAAQETMATGAVKYPNRRA